MKVRNGFVSNSSSSSFVVLVKKPFYEKHLANLHPFLQFIAKELVSEVPVFGEIAMQFQGLTTHGYSWTEYLDEEISVSKYDGPEWKGRWSDEPNDIGDAASEVVDSFRGADKCHVFQSRVDG